MDERELFEEEEDNQENQELKYLTSDPKIPKLFCQIGDKARGWNVETVRLYTNGVHGHGQWTIVHSMDNNP